MCAGALVQSRIDRLVYGAADPKAGACGSVYNIVEDGRLNHLVKVDRGIMADECAQLLKDFFAQQRATGKK
jgi:tRNA(adenine34) deaminase